MERPLPVSGGGLFLGPQAGAALERQWRWHHSPAGRPCSYTPPYAYPYHFL